MFAYFEVILARSFISYRDMVGYQPILAGLLPNVGNVVCALFFRKGPGCPMGGAKVRVFFWSGRAFEHKVFGCLKTRCAHFF